MRDEGLTIPPELSPAEGAVLYLLNRIQRDADLRHHMLHTEAFGRLCRAEANRLAKEGQEEPPEALEQRFGTPPAHCRHDVPRLVQCRKAIAETVEELRSHEIETTPWGQRLIERLERLT